MSTKALIKGLVYTFLELLPSLDQNENMILCTNTSGEKYVCTAKLWQENLMSSEKSGMVHGSSSAQEKIEFFLSLFKGREGLYARRYHSVKTGKMGTPLFANTNGITNYATRKRIDVRNVQTANSFR